MTETAEIHSHYQDILTKLQLINPKSDMDTIKHDVEEYLYYLFIKEIENRNFSAEISSHKLKRDILRQRLQSTRQPLKLRDKKDDIIKKETKYYRLKKIQNALNRKTFYDGLNYPGSFNKRELLYINHTDKTYLKSEFFENERNEDQKLADEFIHKVETTSSRESEINKIDDNTNEMREDYPELQETVDIFKRVKKDQNVEEKKKASSEVIDLDQELKDRILKLDLKPITIEKKKKINLLEFIGFVDEDENSIDE